MISKEEIEKLAELSRLKLSDAEKESLGKDISNILEYVGQIQDSVTVISDKQTPVAPGHRNVMRADEVRGEGDILAGKEEALQAAFPAREGGYNVVRKIIQKDE